MLINATDNSPGNSEQSRIPVLDGWRAICAAMVIVCHLAIGHIDGIAELGVEIFFGISGYVICRGLMVECRKHGNISISGFYLRRALRIIPPLLFYVAAVLLLAWLHVIPQSASGTARALLFVCDVPGQECGGWFGGHTWSLSAEEQFYLVIPFLFVTLGIWRRPVITALVVCMPLVVLALFYAKWTATATALSHFITIGLGVACALYEAQVRQAAARLPAYSSLIIVAAMIFIALHSGSRLATAAHIVLLPPLIMAALLRTATTPSVFTRALNSAPLQSLGKISYGIYLWQQLATWPEKGAVFHALAVPAAIAIAYLTYYTFERRLVRLGHRASAALHGPRVAPEPAAIAKASP